MQLPSDGSSTAKSHQNCVRMCHNIPLLIKTMLEKILDINPLDISLHIRWCYPTNGERVAFSVKPS